MYVIVKWNMKQSYLWYRDDNDATRQRDDDKMDEMEKQRSNLTGIENNSFTYFAVRDVRASSLRRHCVVVVVVVVIMVVVVVVVIVVVVLVVVFLVVKHSPSSILHHLDHLNPVSNPVVFEYKRNIKRASYAIDLGDEWSVAMFTELNVHVSHTAT